VTSVVGRAEPTCVVIGEGSARLRDQFVEGRMRPLRLGACHETGLSAAGTPMRPWPGVNAATGAWHGSAPDVIGSGSAGEDLARRG